MWRRPTRWYRELSRQYEPDQDAGGQHAAMSSRCVALNLPFHTAICSGYVCLTSLPCMQAEAEPAADEIIAASQGIQEEIEPFPMTPTKEYTLTKVSAASQVSLPVHTTLRTFPALPRKHALMARPLHTRPSPCP